MVQFVRSTCNRSGHRQRVSERRCPMAATAVGRRIIASASLLLLALTATSQEIPQAAQPSPPTSAPPPDVPANTIVIPAGTKINVVLTRSIASKSLRAGDDIYAQTAFPVIAGSDLAIPQGTFVQGKMEKLARKGSRGELRMRATSLIFSNGYVAAMPGPSGMKSDEGTALSDPGNGAKAGAVAALAVPAGGALIGAVAAGAKGAAIGGGVGLGIGVVTAALPLAHSRNFVLEAGSPLEMVLQQPLILEEDQVDDAVAFASAHPPSPPPTVRKTLPPPSLPTPSDNGTCYTPGTPGTPDLYIPGTPPIGDAPGTPGTVIPGTPATPPTPYPCP